MSYHFDFSFLLHYWPDLLRGTWQTMRMTVLSIVPGFALGTIAALALIYGKPSQMRAARAYVEVIRNTPLVIQVFWLFFGLAALHIRMPAVVAAIITLVINVSAYTAEIMRAGFEAIPKGQLEAASGLALTKAQTIWYIELPQAIERVYPALVSQFVIMMLTTSIMSQISADELTGVADVIQSFTYRGFEAYVTVAVIYLIIVSMLRLALTYSATLLFPRVRALNRAVSRAR
jgi:polar amino acid transport system permease protein